MPENILAVPSQGFADQNVIAMAPLYTGGKLAGRVKSAKFQTAAAKLGIAAAEITAQSDVTQAYAHVLVDQELARVAKGKVTAEEDQVKVSQDKLNVGHAALVDVLREQAEVADGYQAQIAADNNMTLAMLDLTTLLDLQVDSQITLTDTLDSALAQSPPIPATLVDALKLAFTVRPDLQAANSQSDAAAANVVAAHGAYAPQIYGVGMADASLQNGGSGVGFTVGITASLPLYDGGERRADIDGARAKLERSHTDSLKVRQEIAEQVSAGWLNLQTAIAQVDAASAGLTAATEGYRLADLRYNAGKSTTAERLDALAASIRAEGALAQAKGDVIMARGMFLAAIGQDATAQAVKK